MTPAFRLHCINRDATNLGFLKYRDFQGFLVTGQHSGTHWIKWMLSHAIAHHYGVEPPKFYNNSSSNEIIGHPRHVRIHPHLPRIASTHTIAPYPVDWRWLRRVLTLPPYAVVVRDPRDVLVSNYAKWRENYGVPFSTYVRGEIGTQRYVCDIWWYIHFMNRWGRVAEQLPEKTLVLRYEDFFVDARASLERLGRWFGLALSSEAYDEGVRVGRKAVMAAHWDPNVKERALRHDHQDEATFSEEDMAVFKAIMRENLKYDFGYDLR